MYYLIRLFASFILILAASVQAFAGSFMIIQGNGFSDTTVATPVGGNSGNTIGQQRANVFAKAAENWTSIVNPSVNIIISAQFASWYCEGNEVIFANGGSTLSDRDFAGAPYPGTWYPRALRSHLTTSTSSTAAITVSVNSNVGNASCLSGDNWYYGYDHNPGANQIDLLHIVMHEISHGLGFVTLVNLTSGARQNGYDDIFMKFLRDNSLAKNWPDMSDAERKNSAKDNGDLVWAGAQVQKLTDALSDGLTNGYPRMYAPAIPIAGTSASHWDDNVTYAEGAKHELMEHYPETPFDMALTTALMQDLGWNNVIYDYDSDGTADASDAFPTDPSEWLDTDHDDIGNNSDPDDDGDGAADISDNCPITYNASQLNTDGDSEGDACDSDDDNDTLTDSQEAALGTNPKNSDTDGDNISDADDSAPKDNSLFYKTNGTAKNDQQGMALAVGDMNNDGYDDIFIGSPLADITDNGVLLKDAGRIQILSGANGSELHLFKGAVAKQQLGAAMVVVPDQDLDGIPDIVIGNPLADKITVINGRTAILRDVGSIALYAVDDGELELMEPPYDLLIYGEKKGDHFGTALALDENNNLVVAAPLFDVTGTTPRRDAGRVYVYTGISDTELYTRTGTQAKEEFGSAIAVNTADNQLIIGSPGFDVLLPTKRIDAGRVQLFSTTDHSDDGVADATGIPGEIKGSRFGSALACFSQDIDGDTFTDWVVGMPKADILGSTGKTLRDAGLVQVFSGTAPTPLEIILEGTTASDGFGTAINAQGDINNDGVNDLLISIPNRDSSTLLKNNGQLDVISGSELF